MGKRVTSAVNVGATKRVKINPAFAEIQDALKEAEQLPTNCSAMLAAMVPASLTSLQEDRSKEQSIVIQWVENALLQQKAKLVGEVDVVASKLAGQQAGKARESEEVRKAEAILAQKKAVVIRKKNALAETTIAMNGTKKMLAEKQEEHFSLDKDYLDMTKEQEGLASAFVEHFKVPLESGEALHYEALQPFLQKLDLEESFMVSVPTSCVKTKEQRGAFDHVVLEALEQALLDRANQIKDVVSNRSPESEEREKAVHKAEEQLASDRAAKDAATTELSVAQKEVEAATEAVKAIEQVIAKCDAEIKATEEIHEAARSVQEKFDMGPMASFKNSRDGMSASVLCATAGA